MKNIYLRLQIPIWLIISGILTSLPLIITELGFLQWVAIAPMAVILMRKASDRSVKLRRLYGMGVVYFGVYYSLSFHWFFYMYPLDFAGLSNAASLAVVFVACFGLGLLQAVQSALLFVIFGLITRGELVQKHKMAMPLFSAALWVIFEWWQTIGWWGVPWARLPLGQINATLLVRSASFFGSYFVTFILVAVNFYIALAIDLKQARRSCAVFALTLFCLNTALGSIATATYDEGDDKAVFAAAQGNISSSEKWNSDGESILGIYTDLTVEAAENGASVIVWPETALPYVIFDYPDTMEYLTNLAKNNDITIILSAFTEDEERGERYNSIIEIKPDGSFGESIYSKQRLVPFGEFVPMREFVSFIFPPLANIGMLEEDLTAGNECTVIESVHGNIGCGLCFDSIYESVILGSVRNGAEIIAISTNDSWFSDSAALDMHNAQSRLRAIESGKYVVRSANTGISSIIDPLGNVKDELGALKRGYVISEVALRSGTTLYAYIGNMFVYICMSAIFLTISLRLIEKRKELILLK